MQLWHSMTNKDTMRDARQVAENQEKQSRKNQSKFSLRAFVFYCFHAILSGYQFNRSKSNMKLLMYLFPVLINIVQGAVFFISVQRFTEAGADKVIIGATTTAWSVIYCVVNIIISRLANEKNATALIFTGGGIIALSSLGFLIFDGLYTQFVWLGLIGVAFGCYCAPFQVFMKYVENGSSDAAGVAKAAGRYTAAWSFGFATGPLLFGLLSARMGFCICFAIGILVASGILLIGNYYKKHKPENAVIQESKPSADTWLPDFAWVGWIVAGVGTLTITQIRTMLQPLGETLNFDIASMSWLLFTLSCVQAGFSFLLSFTKHWMFKWLPALLIGIAGAGSLLLIVFSKQLPGFFTAAAIYGLYSGCFYFLFVYYSLLHPTKAARNAGINEAVVAISGIAGPLLGGMLANINGVYPFVFSAILVTGATLLHIVKCAKVKNTVSGKGLCKE